MQAEKGYENKGMLQTVVKIFRTGGVKGFYRGCVPPLWGSGVYRSIQFSAFEATYTYLDNSFGKTQIPFTNGTEYRVVLGGIMSGTVRSLVETPLEYAKVTIFIAYCTLCFGIFNSLVDSKANGQRLEV